ncbi:hypothetical protein FPV67DRAFT_1485301, partial [Lyophyllum atratum]
PPPYDVIDICHSDEDAAAAEAPPWFAAALARGLRLGLAPLTQTVNQMYNSRCADGTVEPYKIVPFNDGTLPTAPPHNLPALLNVESIRTLTGAQTTAYLDGYGVPPPRTINQRKKEIGRAIGCRVEVA